MLAHTVDARQKEQPWPIKLQNRQTLKNSLGNRDFFCSHEYDAL